MDIKINELIVNVKAIEKDLIALYQADSIHDTEEKLKLTMTINQLLVATGLSFTNLALDIVNETMNKKPKLKIVK